MTPPEPSTLQFPATGHLTSGAVRMSRSSRPGRSATRRRPAVPALWRQVFGGPEGPDDGADPTLQQDRSVSSQLGLYDAVLAAYDRRADVLEAVATAPDRAVAVRRVRSLLGITARQATAVVDLPLHRFTAGTRDRVAHRAAELRRALGRI